MSGEPPGTDAGDDATPAGSDGSLVRRFQAGDDDAATALYRRYAAKLERLADRNTGDDLAPRFDADDVVQSVFRTFFRRVRDGLYELPEGEELWRLLLVLALNKVRKLAVHHRAQKRDVSATSGRDPLTLAQTLPAADGSLAFESLRMVVDEALVELPEGQRRIILLRIEGWQVDEIAAETGRSRRTVERTLQAFRAQLRGKIDDPRPDD